jgi:hypothetical protein
MLQVGAIISNKYYMVRYLEVQNDKDKLKTGTILNRINFVLYIKIFLIILQKICTTVWLYAILSVTFKKLKESFIYRVKLSDG